MVQSLTWWIMFRSCFITECTLNRDSSDHSRHLWDPDCKLALLEDTTQHNGLDSGTDYNHRLIHFFLSDSTRASLFRHILPLTDMLGDLLYPLNHHTDKGNLIYPCCCAASGSVWKTTCINIKCKCAQVTVKTCRLNVLNGNNAPDCSKAISEGFLNVKHSFKLHLCTCHLSKRICTITIGVWELTSFQTHERTLEDNMVTTHQLRLDMKYIQVGK